jgi:hypothetical protein
LPKFKGFRIEAKANGTICRGRQYDNGSSSGRSKLSAGSKFEIERSTVLVTESASQGGRSWVLISLVGSVFSPNPNATSGDEYNSATVPYLEFYYPNDSHDPRFNWYKKIFVGQDTVLPRGPRSSNGGWEQFDLETG